jgi:hypothetical protein
LLVKVSLRTMPMGLWFRLSVFIIV